MAEMQYASKGVAGTALGLGIGGTALALMNGGLGGLFNNGNGCCSENTYVTRYELNQQGVIDNKESEIAYLRGQIETDRKLNELRNYHERDMKDIREQIRDVRETECNKWAEQGVINANLNCGLASLKSQVDCVAATVKGITKTAVPESVICDFDCKKK